MAAGFFAKTLATLLASSSRWVEFADGVTAPVHGAVQLDPTTGIAIDTSLPTKVEEIDSLPFSGTGGAINDILFDVDMKGYESISFQVDNAGGNTLTYETSENRVGWLPWLGENAGDSNVQMQATGSTGSVIIQGPRIGRYLRARLSTFTTGTVTATGHLRKAPFNYKNTIAKLRAGHAVGLAPTNARVHSAATTNATLVKSSAGVLNHAILSNDGAAKAFFKFYNSASAPNPGVGTPVLTLLVEPGKGRDLIFPIGIGFSLGIGYTIVGGAADSDTTAVAAAQVTGMLGFS